MGKLITCLAFFMLVSLKMAAQDQQSLISGRNAVSIKAGTSYYHLTGRYGTSFKTDTKFIVTWHAGVTADLAFSKNFSFQPGLILQQKGGKDPDTLRNRLNKYRIAIYYVDIPFNLVYRSESGNSIIVLAAGPYLGIGVSGKLLREYGGITTTEDVLFRKKVKSTDGSGQTYFKRLDLGIGGFIGFELPGRFSVFFDAQMGFGNTEPPYESMAQPGTHTNYLGYGLSLGYRLGK